MLRVEEDIPESERVLRDDLDDLPLDVNFAEFEDIIWPTLAERIPSFEALRVEHAWAGYYEYNVLDHNGIVGQSGPENSFVAAGFSGHGMMHSPGVGRAMAELLSFGEYQTIDLTPLSPGRIESGELVIEEPSVGGGRKPSVMFECGLGKTKLSCRPPTRMINERWNEDGRP
ncbi:FAD-binding oxidoreductase [Burkholderia pyrrocinia]|uniref:NAD(P)/FAD-dependent oxidoreductase n=1 Tax=Burkholderia pyrrocinia TaxID=60550 RepID=UPI0020C706F0|nr:FAD-binding oxidoreductase [Burkholderia pyrrocinia]